MNNPILMITEYMLVQINCLHYAAYLFTIYFCIKNRFILATIFTCLTIQTKQVAIFMIIPVGFYAIGFTLKEINKQNSSRPH